MDNMPDSPADATPMLPLFSAPTPGKGQRLRDLCTGILRALDRNQSVSSDSKLPFGAAIQDEIERELLPRLEEGVRRAAQNVRRELGSWLQSVEELEHLGESSASAMLPESILPMTSPAAAAEAENAVEQVALSTMQPAEFGCEPESPPVDDETVNLTELQPNDEKVTDLALTNRSEPPPAAAVVVPDRVVEERQRETASEASAPSFELVAKRYCRRGDEYLRRNDLNSALVAYGEAIRLNVQLVPAYLKRAQIFRLQKDYERAIEDLNAALGLDPSEVEAYLRRGNILVDLSRMDEAIHDYSTGLELAPDHAVLFMNRGLAHARQGDWERAVADADAALGLDARLIGAYFVRATARARLGDSDGALADLDYLLEIDSRNALAHNERGLVYAGRGDYDRALADYANALDLRPNFTLARFNRAVALRLRGECETAIHELTRLIQSQGYNPVLHFQRGLAYLAQNDFEQALADFETALELAPDSSEAQKARQRTLAARDDATGGQVGIPAISPAHSATKEVAVGNLNGPPSDVALTYKSDGEEPVSPPKKPSVDPPNTVRLKCECGARGFIRWDQLQKPFQCRSCGKRYRVDAGGRMTEIVRPLSRQEKIWRTCRRSICFLPVAGVLLLLFAGVISWNLLARPAELPPLPSELEARGELMAQGWLSKDLVLMRRLTAPSQIPRHWQIDHPAPPLPDGVTASQLLRQAQIDVRITNKQKNRAELTFHVSSPLLEKSIEIRQSWVKEGGNWFFAPVREATRLNPTARRNVRK